MIKRLKNINWKKGGGELLGFAICIPFVIMLICAILSAGYVSSSNQRMTYTAYCVARSACVSTNEARAKDRAEAVLKDMYGDQVDGVTFVSISESASVPNLESNHIYVIIRILGNEWKKGTMLRCTVYQRLDPIMPFSGAIHHQTITMMLENAPADLTEMYD